MKNYRIDAIRDTLRSRSLLFPLDMVLVGATGVGKSSTINALFGEDVAIVGTGVDPETQYIQHYQVNNVFRIHDSAGLGDGLIADDRHKRNLTDLLLKPCTVDNEVYGFIDLALVVLDGSSRDMGTTYQLLEQVVVQCIQTDRVIVSINQADMAMKGRHWDGVKNCPDKELIKFLEEKSLSVQKRIQEATGLSIHCPIYYSATKRYNLDKLMDCIIEHMPHQRRKME